MGLSCHFGWIYTIHQYTSSAAICRLNSINEIAMIRPIRFWFTILSVFTSSLVLAQKQDDLHIWREFIQIVRNGQLPVNKIRPHSELGDEFKQTILGYLDSVRVQASPED